MHIGNERKGQKEEPARVLEVFKVGLVQDPSEVWTSELDQTRGLFAGMLTAAGKDSKGNVLEDNRCSAVACPAAKRDGSLVNRMASAAQAAALASAPAPAPAVVPRKSTASAQGSEKKKPVSGILAQIEAIAAGNSPPAFLNIPLEEDGCQDRILTVPESVKCLKLGLRLE